MYDEEPRALCNIPLSGTVGILSSLVLLSQVLALFLVCSNNFFIYFFELLIAFGMVFFLSQGVRHRKPSHLTVYMAYLSYFARSLNEILIRFWLRQHRYARYCPRRVIWGLTHAALYIFMMIFIIFGIVIGLSFLPSYRRYCKIHVSTVTPMTFNTSHESSNRVPRQVKAHQSLNEKVDYDEDCNLINGAFWLDVWISVALCMISIFFSCVQIWYTLLLYRYLRTRQREQRSTMNVSYQHFVPGAPPRYTPASPHTIQTSPAQVEAGPLPPKAASPDFAALQADSLTTTPPHHVVDKPPLPKQYLRVEGPPEYTETPGPSEVGLASPVRPPENMEEVDLNESKTTEAKSPVAGSTSRTDLLQ